MKRPDCTTSHRQASACPTVYQTPQNASTTVYTSLLILLLSLLILIRI